MTAAADILYLLPWLKWLWVGFIGSGVAVSAWTTREALVDAIWVKRASINEAKRIQASAFLRTEVVTLLIQAALLCIRLWSLQWPFPTNGDSAFAAFVRNWGWDATLVTTLQCVLAYERILNLRDRRRAQELVKPK